MEIVVSTLKMVFVLAATSFECFTASDRPLETSQTSNSTAMISTLNPINQKEIMSSGLHNNSSNKPLHNISTYYISQDQNRTRHWKGNSARRLGGPKSGSHGNVPNASQSRTTGNDVRKEFVNQVHTANYSGNSTGLPPNIPSPHDKASALFDEGRRVGNERSQSVQYASLISSLGYRTNVPGIPPRNQSPNDTSHTSAQITHTKQYPDHSSPDNTRFLDSIPSHSGPTAGNTSNAFLLNPIEPGLTDDNISEIDNYGLHTGPFLLDGPIYSSQPEQDNEDAKGPIQDDTRNHRGLSDNPSLVHPMPHQSRTGPRSLGSRTKLYIGGLFELYGTYGQSELASAELAIRHINAQNFVPGYELKLLSNDTQCNPGYGSDTFYDLMYTKPQIIMLIGTGCSEVAKTLGEIVHYWNLLLVSFGATSPALSERERYPTFYRLAPADSSYNDARKAFIQHFRWNTVGALNEEIETFTLAMNDMYQTFDKEDIKVKVSLTFRTKGDDLRDKLRELKNEDARIIIGSFREETAPHVFCEAYHLGMYGQRYVWMLLGSYRDRWWTEITERTNCTEEQLADAVAGYFSVTSVSTLIGSERSISGYTSEDFLEEYQALNVTSPRSAYAQLTYDSVWTVALTLRKAQEKWRKQTLLRRDRNETSEWELERFTYAGGRQMTRDFFEIMGGLDFVGVSGPVSFEGSDRQGVTVVHQNQGGIQVKIGLFDPENNRLDLDCEGCVPVLWQDGHIPADKYTVVVQMEYIQAEAFYTVCAVSCVGIYLAIVFLSFNLHHRKLRYIKLSSPKLNNVAVVGCVLVYMSVITLGLDDSIVGIAAFSYVCTVRAFLLAAGFSLAFGAMFTKTYRVHQIFRGCHSGLVKSKLLKDKQLLFIIVALLVLDGVVISLWVVIDPMYRTVTNFTVIPSPDHKDILITPQLAKCYSHHMVKWTGALYAYKGLLLLFGVYMAWETRHVKIPALNDSQYIGMNIYNVVLSSVTVVALSNLISDRPTLSYSLVAALIILSTTVMLCLLFLPKVYAIIKHNGAPVVATSGLTVEANTRRFVVDEKRELYYRAEVQNRVYKRELHELDQELKRLQRSLDVSCPPSDMSLVDDTKSDVSLVEVSKAPNATRADPVTDADDITSLPDLGPVHYGPKHNKLEKQDSGFHSLSFKNQNFASKHHDSKKPFSHRDNLCIQNSNFVHLESEQAIRGSPTGPQQSALRATRRHDKREGNTEETKSLLAKSSRPLSLPVPAISDKTIPKTVKSSFRDDQSKGCCDKKSSSVRFSRHDTSHKPPLPTLEEGKFSSFCMAVPNCVKKRNVKGAGGLPRKTLALKNTVTPGVKQHRIAKQRADILRRELSRIQSELKSLGEVEMEVSYV